MMKNKLLIIKVLIKNDLSKIIIWLVSIISMNLLTAYMYPDLYATDEAILSYANIMANPAMKGLLGSAYPTEVYNHAIIFTQEILMFSAIAVAIMNIYFSIKFTKVYEEDGITEIINSKPIERNSILTSSIVILTLLNFIIFITITLGLFIIDLNGANFLGAFVYGSILFLIGLFFAGIGLLGSKLFNNSSSANTFAYLSLIVFYIIRAVGDVLNDTISLFSPFGWLTKIQVFYNNNFLFLGLMLIFGLILFGISLYLYNKIDYGSGVFNLDQGKKTANKILKSNMGFILKLEKIQIIVWLVSIFIITAAFGAIFQEFEVFLEIDIIKQFFGDGSDFSKTIVIYLIKIISIFGLIPSLMIILKLGKEERNNQIENIFVRNTRLKYVLSHYLFAIILAVIMQITLLIGIYITGKDFILDNMSFTELVKINLTFIPATWLFISLALLLLSIDLKYLKYIWIYFSFIFLTLYLEEILKLPKIIMNFSIFYHLDPGSPKLLTNVILILLSIITLGFSLNFYKKRNLN